MPFQDLPCQGERSAPILDITHPLSIKRYFDHLEFLFLKHSILDTQEKKLAAVMYPSEAEIEELWRTAFAFSDPTCSYEDFKVEIIELYLEVEAAQPTLEELDKLVVARAPSQICSEQELGEYNRKFITISHFLISKNRLGLQVPAFPLAPQSPSPAQPNQVATVHKPAWKCVAPLISALRDEPKVSTTIPATSIPIPLLPPAAHLFQPVLQFGQADIPTSTPTERSIVSAQLFSYKAKPPTAQRTEAKNPVMKAPLQLTCDLEEEEARPEKCPQGPVPVIEAHGPAEPLGIASEVLGSPSEDPTAQTSFSGPEYSLAWPKHHPAQVPVIEAHGPTAPSGIAPEVLGSLSEDLTAPPSFSGAECSIAQPKHHPALASVIDTHSDPEARIVPASISNTTNNPSSVSDPPSTSAQEAHTLAIPSEVSFSTCITRWLLVLLAGYTSLSLSVHSLISTNVQVSAPLSTYSDSTSSITKVPPPSSVFASIPHPASISPSISDSICVLPLSMRFSVLDPECPQLANQVPNTPKAIRSRPRWPQSQVSQLVSVHMRQQAQRPPQASSHTPLPYFLYFIGRCNERHSAEPSDNQLATQCQETAWKLLFHPCKPPDIIQAAPTIFGHAHMTGDSHFFSWEENRVPGSMKVISTHIGIDQIVTLNACDTLGQLLRLRQYPPLTNHFAFDPGGPGLLTMAQAGVGAGPKVPQQRAQEAQIYLTKSDMQHRVAQEQVQWRQCQHHADIGSLYAAPDKVYVPTAIHPRLVEARMAGATLLYHKSNVGEVPQAHAYQPSHLNRADFGSSARQREHYHAPENKFATSATACRQPRQPSFMKNSTHQDTSSAGKFATTPQSRGFPSFGRRLRTMSFIGSSTYKSRGIVHKGAKGNVDRSTSAQMGAQAQGLSNCATVTRTSAAQPKTGDNLQYF
ncbi:hypothetical protein BJY52DRAFT_1195916 [Lactarius psammicola]|nr:hypothetical protein BJY52DRAFT_1195916 [Lactarius psammicola]